MGTSMYPNTQILLDQFTARRAHLGCVGGVDQYHRAPSIFRFVAGVLNQLCPSDIRNAFAHPARATHLLRLKFLKREHLERVYQTPADLMSKVLAAELNSLVN